MAHVNYANLVWGTTTMANKHNFFQKRVPCSIHNLSYTAHPADLFEIHNTIKIFDMYHVRLPLNR